MDIADLHVICVALANDAELLCSSDQELLGFDPMGELRIVRPAPLAEELGLIVSDTSPAQVPRHE